MRFLVDECTGPAVACWLRSQGNEVFSVYEQARGLNDDDVIQKTFAENWILITNDKGFEEKIYRQRRPHRGVIFLRLEDERAPAKIEVLRRVLEHHSEKLSDNFVVVTESQIRFAKS